MMQFVGLDVHGEATAISIRSARGRVVRRLIVPTTSAALRRAFLKTRGRMRIVCEAGPLARWVRDTLETRLREVIVCDRRRTRLVAGGSKNDKIDADKLSELLWKNDLRPVYVPRDAHVFLRRLVTHYLRMLRDRSRIIFRLRALFLESGIRVVTPRSAPERVPIHRLRDAGSKYVARSYLAQLKTTSLLLTAVRGELLELARTFPAFELLQTVPYVGEMRAAQLIAIVGHPERFRSRRRFWSYGALGLIQRTTSEHRVSNGEVVRNERSRGLRLAKTGQPLLKKILRDIALFSSLGRGTFREIYEAHSAKGHSQKKKPAQRIHR